MERRSKGRTPHYRQSSSVTLTCHKLRTPNPTTTTAAASFQPFISVSLGMLVLCWCLVDRVVAVPLPAYQMSPPPPRVARSVQESGHSVTFAASTRTFSEELRSPCKGPLPVSDQPADARHHGLTTRYLINKTNVVRHYVDRAIELWSDCPATTYTLDLDPPLPSPDDLLNIRFVTAIETIYEILVIHASHFYHMYHQENASTEGCEDRPGGPITARLFESIFANTQDLMCDIRVSNPGAQLDRATSDGLLKARLTADSRCSTRINRDCLVAKSFQKVLVPLVSFLERHDQRQSAPTR